MTHRRRTALEQRDVAAEGAHEEGVADRVGFGGGDGDALVDHVEAVADRAQAHRAIGDRFAPVLDRQAGVGHAGGHQDGEGADLRDFALGCVFGNVVGHEQAVFEAQVDDLARHHGAAVALELDRQVAEQDVAGHAFRKAGIVVRDRDQAQPAVALVDQGDFAGEAAQVDGGGQAAGAAADDERIVDGGSGRGGNRHGPIIGKHLHAGLSACAPQPGRRALTACLSVKFDSRHRGGFPVAGSRGRCRAWRTASP